MIELKQKLIPEAHNLTHYLRVIRKVGPLKHLSMMRFESKHKFFTDAAKSTQCFINIRKSLAFKHQEQICLKKYSIENVISESKRDKAPDVEFKFKFEAFLNSDGVDLENLDILPFLDFNSYRYQNGLFLIKNKLIYQIISVLRRNGDYSFLCEIYKTKTYDESLNSIEIVKYSLEQHLAHIKLSELPNKQTFSSIACNSKIYIIAENLSVFELTKL